MERRLSPDGPRRLAGEAASLAALRPFPKPPVDVSPGDDVGFPVSIAGRTTGPLAPTPLDLGDAVALLINEAESRPAAEVGVRLPTRDDLERGALSTEEQ